MSKIKKRSVVGSLLDISDMEHSESRNMLYMSDSKQRRLTSSSSGYSSSKPGQRLSQVVMTFPTDIHIPPLSSIDIRILHSVLPQTSLFSAPLWISTCSPSPLTAAFSSSPA